MGYHTHDNARSQWLFPELMYRALRQAQSFQDALWVFIGPPGFVPRNARLQPLSRAREDASIERGVQSYVAAQFAVLVAFSSYVLWAERDSSLTLLDTASFAILWSLSALGGLLDGRAYAPQHEVLRQAAWETASAGF